MYTVLTALIARQSTLALEFSSAPQIWNGHSAPLFLRPMADVYISLEWISADLPKRAQLFIEHGLGQAKLQIEHWKKALENEPENHLLRQMIENESHWIDSQHLRGLVNVNIGSWSGKSIRQMAEDVGILDFYNYVYCPFSNCGHSTWWHLGRYNIQRSTNPLHGYRFLPSIVQANVSIEELLLCAKYLDLDKTFNFFDEKILKVDPRSDLQNILISKITQQENSKD
jgi:hypothetical protein